MWVWVPGGVGLASGLVAGLFLGLRQVSLAALGGDVSASEAFRLAREAADRGNVAIGFAAGAAACAIAAVSLAVWRDSPVGVALVPLSEGGALTVATAHW